MLMALGISSDGEEITVDDPMYDAIADLRQSMQSDVHNPWNGQANGAFQKEYFFEYLLAQIFKADKQLMQEAEKVSSCYFKGMSYYRRLDGLVDDQRNSYRERVHKYLPKEHLMLAYYFSANLRYLWAAAKSNTAFNAVIETGDIGPESLLDVIGAAWPEFPSATKYIYTLLSSKPEKPSFMTVWQKVKERLLQKIGPHMDLVSYSGHGIVLSFANDIIKLQNTSPIARRDLMDKLGFAVIDSYYSNKLQPFYALPSDPNAPSPIGDMTIDAPPIPLSEHQPKV
jgi:hypothetical protein